MIGDLVGFRTRTEEVHFVTNPLRQGDTYASANLLLAMLIIIWIHAIIMNTIMIFEV